MHINQVIEKHFNELSAMCRNTDKIISQERTSEDIFSDTIMVALNKYRNKDVDEETALDYIKKTLLLEFYFAPKRFDNIIYTDNLWDIMDDTSFGSE